MIIYNQTNISKIVYNKGMNTQLFIYAILALGILSVIAPQAQAINEDEFYICAETYPNDKQPKQVDCTIVNESFFNNSQYDTLRTQFNNQLDIFDSSYLQEVD